MSYTTPACFSTFFRSTMVPTLVENNFLVYLFVNFFVNTIIMIMIEIQDRGKSRGVQRVPWNLLLPVKALGKLQKSCIGKLKSVYYHTRFYAHFHFFLLH